MAFFPLRLPLVLLLLLSGCLGAVQQLNVSGLVAAVFSPFDANLELNVSVVPAQAAFLQATGVEYAYIAGTSGESVSLTQSEREKLLEAWIDVAPTYGLKIIVHVGANALAETKALTRHAVSLNSPHLVAFASMPTSFFKPASVEALVELMRDIAAEAPALPFYYYHIPSLSGVEFSMFDFAVAAAPHIPNLMGVKFTGLYYAQSSFPDALRLLNYATADGRTFEVLTGRDEMLVQCLATGVRGFIGSQYNFAAELYNEIIRAYDAGNVARARELTFQADNLLTDVSKNVTLGRNGVKYMMVEAGVDVGEARPPYVKMSSEEKEQERQNTIAWCAQTNDVLSWCKDL